jgi:ATP-dependent RNA helicase RhlE
VNSFETLGLSEPLLKAVRDLGYVTPSPIQAAAIPALMTGRDLLGVAQTGTGKTAAFALPILHRMAATPRRVRPGTTRVLILTPTRELAIQIDQSFREYAAHLKLRTAAIFGGVGQQPQVDLLRTGLDVLTATPGRLLDLLGQRHLSFEGLDTFVLDEADRMLDMGFLPDVRRVVAALPKQRHSAFFSATMPPDIANLARTILTDPVHVEVAPESTTAEKVVQRVMFVEKAGKPALLAQIVGDPRVGRALVFTRTKHGANKVVEQLERGQINAAAIHGNKSQNARQRAMDGFRSGQIPVLVATDIAARGIDVDGITHVINYDLPNEPESYVHRIGRTARAGASGLAVSFCDREEIAFLRDIERLISMRIEVAGDRIGLPPEILDPGPVGANRRVRPSAPPPGRGGGGGGGGGPRRGGPPGGSAPRGGPPGGSPPRGGPPGGSPPRGGPAGGGAPPRGGPPRGGPPSR